MRSYGVALVRARLARYLAWPRTLRATFTGPAVTASVIYTLGCR
jgi:hypothetical protein